MTSTHDRLLDAALEVLRERGYRGGGTKEIAKRAGLSEMTLFRHFPTKAELVEAALIGATESFRAAAAEPTDNVAADLERLAEGYVTFIDESPELVDRVLPEVASDPDLGPMVVELMRRNADAVRRLLVHHQSQGRLVPAEPSDLMRAFLGPLFARAGLRHVLGADRFDAGSYVLRFLDGHRASGAPQL